MSLGESLAESHAYNPIRDFSHQKVSPRVSPRVSDRIICMTPGETLSGTLFLRGYTTLPLLSYVKRDVVNLKIKNFNVCRSHIEISDI